VKILIANPGSTSYKCKLLDMDSGESLFQAAVERIGDPEGIFRYKFSSETERETFIPIPNYQAAIKLTLDSLAKKIDFRNVAAVGFKVVLAKGISGCVELTDDVLKAMREYLPLAPVHNQIYLTAIQTFKKLNPDVPLVGLFETSFHSEIPVEAFLYGIPFEFFEKYGIRKYGFHGASHRFISEYVKEKYANQTKNLRIISCHLGGSSSVCAIKNGISVDTSMGMSPQSGLLNATRVGDLDSFSLLYLMEKENLTIEEIRKMLISNGGVKGISGISGDFRDIEKAMLEGNDRAKFAFDTFAYYVKRYIGEYLAILNGADFIVFTGGLGQNSPTMRSRILSGMENLGIVLNSEKNEAITSEGVISDKTSRIKILAVPTNEELIVARSVKELLDTRSRQ